MRRQSKLRHDLTQLPLFLLMLGMGTASMLVPAAYALITDQHGASQAFFYAGLLGCVAFLLIGIAHAGRAPQEGALGPLLSLFSAFVFLPAIFAIPFVEALPTTRYVNAYFEMLSALTTTGATLFEDPDRLGTTLHLWRAQVGWMGGLLMWVAAVAILAPLNLGGFEVTAQAEPGRRETGVFTAAPLSPRERIGRALKTLGPLYGGLTLLLWVLLMFAGQQPLNAICHAMSVMATSGITAGGDPAAGGVIAEMVMAMFMLFALSRLTFSSDTMTATQGGLRTDPEFRIGLCFVILVPLILFGRHFIGAYEIDAGEGTTGPIRALWGSVFTVISFLSTTGFVSQFWSETQSWSGLGTPGLILMGLALIGGGVATTAGGVKLLRVFALYRNGVREMERLVHPNSVSGAGVVGRRLQSGGAYIAWIFFMLLALSFAAVTLALTLVGVSFDQALVLAVATLSTTGPLTEVGGETPIVLLSLSDTAKFILAGAMVLGRLETLAIIALLTPDLWRS
ncbi:TrkH family potassium uptake protein [Sulfitobacter donghicola]|uniref:Potassium transporter TrkH n=1 Tax=Sulfitobacter donghicola DSW-25 = KCTC 12864 = JCM 14565 TaxID=1300350 RepID=A0A073IDH6_9RHOB|nr:potassium transporter TrkG [Sulfitobacter donghicola]KEJ88418.1 potassium transporter TrkH [Sulfitobacter donghicola DSW-25 = KCTC 12864 = JCM 14565]KIN69715.1 Trk system potassium uptake protein [Sulfitobacter donghicola DSW-25 = KCTC 12864 = JCM 14565]